MTIQHGLSIRSMERQISFTGNKFDRIRFGFFSLISARLVFLSSRFQSPQRFKNKLLLALFTILSQIYFIQPLKAKAHLKTVDQSNVQGKQVDLNVNKIVWTILFFQIQLCLRSLENMDLVVNHRSSMQNVKIYELLSKKFTGKRSFDSEFTSLSVVLR